MSTFDLSFLFSLTVASEIFHAFIRMNTLDSNNDVFVERSISLGVYIYVLGNILFPQSFKKTFLLYILSKYGPKLLDKYMYLNF